MNSKKRAAKKLLDSLNINEDLLSELMEGCSGDPCLCNRPSGLKYDISEQYEPSTKIQRVLSEQYGPGPDGDSFWGNVFVRIDMKWVRIPFSL